MADKLISQLGATAAVLTTDLWPKEPTGGPPAEKATIAQLVTLLNTIYAPITGGAYVLKAGDTMTGPLLFSPDNTVDIGASGATRARTGYFGTSLVTALLASPAATALSFASAGTIRANFSTAGHLLFNADGTYDIGASGATRPKDIYVSGFIIAGAALNAGTHLNFGNTGYIQTTSRSNLSSPSDGVWLMQNAATTDFNRLQFGGTTSAFPSLKRSAALLQARLADDSLFTEIECSNIITNNAAAAFSTNTTLTNFAAAALGTLTNAPTAGNPAKWIAIDDNGTTRYIPTWT